MDAQRAARLSRAYTVRYRRASRRLSGVAPPLLGGAPLRCGGESRVALGTFLWGHLADDESPIDNSLVHLLLAGGLLRVAAFSL
jgi:hypothetical protein